MGEKPIMTAAQCDEVADSTLKKAEQEKHLPMMVFGSLLKAAADALRHHETRAGSAEAKAPPEQMITPWDLFAAGALARGGLTIEAAAEFADDMVKERGKRALKGAL